VPPNAGYEGYTWWPLAGTTGHGLTVEVADDGSRREPIPHEEKLIGLVKNPPVVLVATRTHWLHGVSGSLRNGPFVA
jgi:hypothetical protein